MIKLQLNQSVSTLDGMSWHESHVILVNHYKLLELSAADQVNTHKTGKVN